MTNQSEKSGKKEQLKNPLKLHKKVIKLFPPSIRSLDYKLRRNKNSFLYHTAETKRS